MAGRVEAYQFGVPSIELGVLSVDGEPVPDARIRIPLTMLNRHGLIAGATGTGKTISLQVLAERISEAGVPVFVTDVKGDLNGMASPGVSSEKLLARTAANGQEWTPKQLPVELMALGGQGKGVPLRATVSSFGPILLARVLGLNATQESSLGLVFHYADANGLALLDLSDLVAVLTFLDSDGGRPTLKEIGGLSAQTVGVILRAIVNLRAQGADVFFGEPEFDTRDLFRLDQQGRGVISMLELPNVQDRPALFSTFLMWLLADLYHELPEVGDLDKPRLVFFFDEAHLLFDDASKAFMDEITRTVRLIRSKGVGIFFITQTADDVSAEVLAQLGSRIQHQMRVHTPADQKALRSTVKTFPTSDYNLEELLTSLGTGQAVVFVMDPDGVPTPPAWTRVFAPCSKMGASGPEEINRLLSTSNLMSKYYQSIDRESAREVLAKRLAEGAARAEAEQAADQQNSRLVTRNTGQRGHSSAPQRKEKSVVEQVAGSSVMRQFARSAGREIVRSLFGAARRR